MPNEKGNLEEAAQAALASATTMETRINKELLKYHVSTAIFCQSCQTVMDMRSSVSFDITAHGKTAPFVLCSSCFDRKIDGWKARATEVGATITILDGRELYPSKRGRK